MTSRVARAPIDIPKGVEVKLNGTELAVKGAKGNLAINLHRLINVTVEGNIIKVVLNEDSIAANEQGGTSRALIMNMVKGVSAGFERKLLLEGVGYRAQAQGKNLQLTLGFSHPVVFEVPIGITIQTPSQTEIIISGADKCLVGQVAADIRSIRPPEPYKGKGVRYSDEKITLKETKKK